MSKVLVIRYGAFGDCIGITPAIKRLKELGHYIVLNTSERGEEVFRHCPHIDELIIHDKDIHIDDLNEHWEKLKEQVKPDIFINFSESIECNCALHPINPEYIYPKPERYARGNRNYYDVTEEWAKLEGCQKIPELFFTEEEETQAKSYLKKGKFNILWVLSGSGKQKVYPWTEYVMGQIFKDYKDVHIITVGDYKCKLLETLQGDNVTNIAGEVSMRVSMALTKFVDLVISPDTGVLHASGCYDTPKIGLLGHTTIENITKYFKNDYSIEANCACAPCFRLIYDYEIQCPIDVVTKAAWCMAVGIPPEVLYERIKNVINR
jgi:ADP-heptose:LPS heptosyltransferase